MWRILEFVKYGCAEMATFKLGLVLRRIVKVSEIYHSGTSLRALSSCEVLKLR
jgi:hypothetical protein